MSILETPLPNGFNKHQVAAALSPKLQELILLPTEKCNFRCTYCYEDFELGRMTEKTQRAIELFVDRRVPDLDELRFSWFGGEPLLAKNVVLRLSRYAKSVCDANGVKFTGGLTTNAYALDKTLAGELVNLHQDFFQITLDGWKDAHDALRRRADGAGTFDVIWNNLVSLKTLQEKFEVCVRVHVRRDNQDNLEILMREYAKEFFDDRRFYLDFQHLRDMGGEGGKTVNGVTRDELASIEVHLRKTVIAEVKRLNSQNAAPNIQQDIEPSLEAEFILAKASNAGESAGNQRQSEQVIGAPYICYAGKANSLLIRSNGRLGKCTVAFDDDRNDIGYLADDGKVIVDQEKFRPWMRGLETLDVEVVGCPVHTLPKAPAVHQKLQSIAVTVVGS